MTNERKLLANRIITPDGTVLQSYSQHDYKSHKDKITGETYMVDGGLSYCRSSVNDVPATLAYVYTDDAYETIREGFSWGTRGVNGDQPLVYKPLKTLTTDHIEAIIKTQYQIPDHIRNVFVEELAYRDHQPWSE